MPKSLRQIKEDYAKSFVNGDFPTLEKLIEDHPEHAQELTKFCINLWPFAGFLKDQLTETLLWWIDDSNM